jgi:hypothetical protein
MADLQCTTCKQWKGIRDFRCTGRIGGAYDFSEVCVECEDPLDCDTHYMGRDELAAEVKKLRSGIRAHRDAKGHNLCWYVPELWNLLPDKVHPTPEAPPTEEFLQHCAAYRASLNKTGP